MPRRRLSEEELERIVSLREKGYGFRVIAEEIGCSTAAVTWQCLRLGAEPPKATWPLGDKGPKVVQRGGHVVRKFTPEEDAMLLRLSAHGATVSAMRKATGRQPNSITGRLMTLARREARAKQNA